VDGLQPPLISVVRHRVNPKLIPVLVFAIVSALSPSLAATKFRIGFPEVPLKTGERIVGFQVQFISVHVRTISKIPKDWSIELKLDPQPFPRISGGCGHGAGALMSSKELPVFEIEPFENSATEITAEATIFLLEDFGTEKVRKIRITLKGTRP